MFNNYNVSIITLLVLILYYISDVLVKTKKISLVLHRKIWNNLLAISFLTSGVLGLILAFLIDYKLTISWYFSLLWFHVEFGIVMALIAIFHFTWHFRYYFSKNK